MTEFVEVVGVSTVINTYYVSLTKDLLYCYLAIKADSSETVRKYLVQTYFDKESHLWKLPWCSIYDNLSDYDKSTSTIIPSGYGGVLTKDMFND